MFIRRQLDAPLLLAIAIAAFPTAARAQEQDPLLQAIGQNKNFLFPKFAAYGRRMSRMKETMD